MITLVNYLAGQLLRKISLFVLNFTPAWKLQLNNIKIKVIGSNNQRKNIPDYLTNSIIKIEDKRFFYHNGIDLFGIMRAFINNLTSKRIQGASTIVQQLIRNFTNEREITLKRKFKEIIFAVIIDNEFSKEDILFAYFDTYQFENCIGVFNFCKTENYDIENLTHCQSAEIAARFKYPTIIRANYLKYLKRVRTIEIKTTPNTDGWGNKLVTVFAFASATKTNS